MTILQSLDEAANQPSCLLNFCFAIADHAPLPMAAVEGAGHIVRHVNPAFCHLTGQTVEQLVGKPLFGSRPERHECLTLLDRVFRTGNAGSHAETENSGSSSARWSYIMWPLLAGEHPVGVMIQVTEPACPPGNENTPMLKEISEHEKAEEQLRQNHDTFFTLIQNAPFGLYVVDAQFRMRQVSAASQKVFASVKPLIGRDFEEILRTVWNDPFVSEALAHFRHTLATGEPYAAPNTVQQRHDISDVESYDWKIERIMLPDGQYGVVCYFYDVTERNLSEQKFRNLLECAPDAMVIVNAEGMIALINAQTEKLFGYARGELIGQPVELLIPQRFRGRHTGHRQGFFAAPAVRHMGVGRELWALRRDGTEFPVEISLSPLQTDKEVLVTAAIRDITERKQAAKALIQSEAKLQDFVENASIGLHWVGPDGLIIWANRTELDLLGYTREEYFGHHINEFHADPPVIEDILTRLTGGQTLRDHEARLRCKDGSIRLVSISSNALFEEGRLVHTRCFTQDITERKEMDAQLRKSEERFRTLFDIGPGAIYSIDTSGMIQEFNRQATFLWGREPVLGDTEERFCGSLKLFRPDGSHMPHEQCPMADVVSGRIGDVRDAEVQMERVDGSRITVVVNIRAVKNARGEITGAINCFYDITGRKRGEDALRGRTAQFRTLLDEAPLGVYVVDKDFRLSEANPIAVAVFGDIPDLIGRDFDELIHRLWRKPYADEIVERFRHTLATGDPYNISERIEERTDSDATESYEWQISRIPLPDDDYGVVCYFRDISQRVADQQKLRESEERYRDLFNSIDEGFCVIEMIFGSGGQPVDYLFLEVNPSFEKQSGITGATGRRMREIATEEVEAHWFETYGRVAITGEPVRTVNEFKALNRWFDIYACRVGGTGSRKVAVVFNDITGRRELEIALMARAEDLVRADRSKNEFLAMLAHELRNPLAPLRNAAELLKMENASAQDREQAQRILGRQIENMSRMIDDLLDVSRITEGKIELRRDSVALEAILTAATDMAQPGCAAQHQKLTVLLPAKPVFLMADATRLEQVFNNLLGNACKYGGNGCHIVLQAGLAAGIEPTEVIVRVTDDGVGITPELLPRVFDLFAQASRTLDRAHGGLGIGLTLVQRLVKLHGGSVEAHSAGLGRGSEFIVRLPIIHQALPPPKSPPAPPPLPSHEIPRRILIVDDNKDSARSLSLLQTRRGHITHTAFTGLDALTAAAFFLPEVVLLDIGLPGMDGYEVARSIRAMPELTGVFIVAISGYDSESDRALAKTAGFDEYMVKPADLTLLHEWILARPGSSPA
ncbi:MAG: hybrid sensor histidine kinase/response regulator [Prosthecobacter sp.]|nr:hybrid sensor histidine kinase/response regulator [Prosthecobacter sp.]